MRIDRPARIKLALWALAIPCALVALSACPGTLQDKERFLQTGDCPDIEAELFPQQCGGTGCHGAVSPAAALDLVSPNVASRVVGVSAAGCVGTLADPDAPEQSVLYTKLTDPPPCKDRMPLGKDPLSNTHILCVRDWIAAQAPSDGGIVNDSGAGDAGDAGDGGGDGG